MIISMSRVGEQRIGATVHKVRRTKQASETNFCADPWHIGFPRNGALRWGQSLVLGPLVLGMRGPGQMDSAVLAASVAPAAGLTHLPRGAGLREDRLVYGTTGKDTGGLFGKAKAN